jgi:hypothetical protein
MDITRELKEQILSKQSIVGRANTISELYEQSDHDIFGKSLVNVLQKYMVSVYTTLDFSYREGRAIECNTIELLPYEMLFTITEQMIHNNDTFVMTRIFEEVARASWETEMEIGDKLQKYAGLAKIYCQPMSGYEIPQVRNMIRSGKRYAGYEYLITQKYRVGVNDQVLNIPEKLIEIIGI